MFGKFSEQVKKSTKPVNSLVALNAKKLEELSQMQTEFFTGFMADSVKYVEAITIQTEVKGVIAAQTSYAEAVKERIANASKHTYGAINDIREEYTDLLKTSLNDASAEVPAAFQAPTVATATPSKPAASAKPAASKAPAKKADSKPVAKPASKPAAKAKPALKTASKPARAKSAKEAQNKPVTKPVAKPVVKAEARPIAKPTTKQNTSTPAPAAAKKA